MKTYVLYFLGRYGKSRYYRRKENKQVVYTDDKGLATKFNEDEARRIAKAAGLEMKEAA